jgi:c-di-GMP-related signal transduction protein
MSTSAPCTVSSDGSNIPPSAPTRYLARQPIFDRRGDVFAYELLFRSGAQNGFADDGEMASRTMLDNVVMYGFRRLTNGLPAFINCTAATLIGHDIDVLPPAYTVLEVLESVDPSDEIVLACQRLQRLGFKIALDDFVYDARWDRLIAIADFIKFDILATSSADRRRILNGLRGFRGKLLAEKVETREQYQETLEEGFELFQGYFFCKPNLLKRRKVPANRLVHLQLLRALQQVPLDVAHVSDVVKSEPSIAYRLLRYVNSPALGLRETINSVPKALMIIGDDAFRRMATLACAVELSSRQSIELVRTALTRARFCETAAPFCGLDPTSQYMLGLFSLLDAMLEIPLADAVAPLGLPAFIRDALLGVENVHACPLRWLSNHEHADFEACDRLAQLHQFPPEALEENYRSAMEWTDSLLSDS